MDWKRFKETPFVIIYDKKKLMANEYENVQEV